MKFKDFINRYDDWMDVIVINDNVLNRIISCPIYVLMERNKDLYTLYYKYKYLMDKEVISFGFWEGELCVRLDV
jgi:hypothetical protein